MDNRLAQHLRGSASFVNFDDTPKRTLDLGCGVCYICISRDEPPKFYYVDRLELGQLMPQKNG